MSMKIQERDRLLVWELSIVIPRLSQFGGSLRANNLIKMRSCTAFFFISRIYYRIQKKMWYLFM